jgi:hypothetical protein
MLGLGRKKDDALFEPRMPDVDEPAALADTFDRARSEVTALKTNTAKAIPFAGMLLGVAYIGHAVWAFEGHSSALAHGCRGADVLLVDSGMLPHLQLDWHAIASRAMRRQEIYIHDRNTFRLSPAAHVVTG